MPKNRLAVSLVAMEGPEEVQDFLANCGQDVGLELSYKMSPEFLDAIEPIVAGKVLSVHACCPLTPYFPNLASADPAVVAQSLADLRSTLDTALRFGARIVVLHAGYATDSAMPSDTPARLELLSRAEFLADVAFLDGAICGADYNRKPEYLEYASRTKERLIELAGECSGRGLRLAAENLNPRVGYLFHAPEEMVELSRLHPNLGICLDVGHLYVSSFAYGFDFLEGVRTIVADGRVLTCHLHGNSSAPGRFRDDHHGIDRHGFPMKEVLEILADSGANLVLETVEEPLRNLRVLRGMLE
jgi:sugar phosphate isomerase/epimerase